MARTYGNKPVLSKVKIGEGYYYLKDADVRAILDAINDSVFEKLKLDLGAIGDENKQNGLAVVSDIKAYIDRVAELSFDVVKLDVLPEANAAAYLTYHNNIVLVPDANKVGTCIEWIIVRSGEAASYVYKWEQIGTSETDLADYVKKVTKIAGINLEDDITAAELQTALGLKKLAYKDSATGTVAGQTISGVKASYTPVGTVTVEHTATDLSLAGKYTPAGSVEVTAAANGKVVTGGSISVSVKDSETATAASITRDDYTPAGSVAVTLSNATVSEVTDAGALASKAADTFVAPSLGTGFYTAGSAATWTGAKFTKPTLGNASKAAFATEGIKATVGTGEDAECLVFSAATTSDAVTAQGAFSAGDCNFGTFNGGSATVIDTTKFVPGSFTEGKFTAGKLPTVAEKTIGVESAAFTGTKAAGLKVSGVSYVKQEIDSATFTATQANLGFTGTQGDIAVAGKYDKANAEATFTGTAGEATVGDIEVKATDVTVE